MISRKWDDHNWPFFRPNSSPQLAHLVIKGGALNLQQDTFFVSSSPCYNIKKSLFSLLHLKKWLFLNVFFQACLQMTKLALK